MMNIGDNVTLDNEEGCIVPPGSYIVTAINADGSFCVDGGCIGVWPRRIVKGNDDVQNA